MSEQSTDGIERRGITHCYPHDNKMPCAECARRIKRSVNKDTEQ